MVWVKKERWRQGERQRNVQEKVRPWKCMFENRYSLKTFHFAADKMCVHVYTFLASPLYNRYYLI